MIYMLHFVHKQKSEMNLTVVSKGQTALSVADFTLVDMMLKAHPEVNVNHIITQEGDRRRIVPSLLTRAVKNNKKDLVRRLLERCALTQSLMETFQYMVIS